MINNVLIFLFLMQASIEQAYPHQLIDLLLPPPCTSRPLSLSTALFPQRTHNSNQFCRSFGRRSTAENTIGEYLHARLMRRNVYTPLAKPETPRQELPECGFIRSRRVKPASLGRTSTANTNRHHKTPQNLPERPTTTQKNSFVPQKTSYFDELLTSTQGLTHLKIISHIGKGAFSIVSMATSKEGKQNYAVKTYDRLQAMDWNRLACIKREIRHLRGLSNERVVKLYDVVREHKKLFLVMENAGKSSLAGVIRRQGKLSQVSARRYLKQILQGVAYIHGEGVCHRDLKPENILLDSQGNIKLIDFGFSASAISQLTTLCGTPAYMAPEITKKTPYNGGKCDIWAVGVILYLMVVGVLPFRAATEQQLFRLISIGKLRYRQQGAPSISVRRLISRMLNPVAEQRPSASSLLLDPWLTQNPK